jgi:hypothetical protein
MKTLAIGVLLAAAASQAAGCIVHATDRDPGGGGGGGGGVEVAAITAKWSLRNMLDGATTRCPTGFDTVELVALPVDDRGNAIGEPAVDLFDCDARAGASTDLVPALYQVWIEVRSHDRASLYAQSLSQVLDVRQVDQAFTTDILNDGGYFQFAWDLVGQATSRPLSCAQVVGLNTVKAVSALVAGPIRAYDDLLACEDHATVTGGLLQGPYTIDIDAMVGSASVGGVTLTNKTIAGQNRVTDLGVVIIPITGL